jgi:GntR family transcriptional regulator
MGSARGATVLAVRLDRSSALPLHYQLQHELRGAIERGDLAPDEALPGEPQLVLLAGVSRPTVRQAIAQLVREGLLRRERGRGTFASDEALHVRLAADAPGGAALRALSLGTRIQPSCIRRTVAPDDVRQCLALTHGEEVVEVVGLRVAEATPVAYVRADVCTRLVPSIERAELAERSFAEVVEQRSGLRFSRGELSPAAVTIAADVAQAIGAQPGGPALRLEVVGFAGELPMACSRTVVPAEHRRFRFDLTPEDVVGG